MEKNKFFTISNILSLVRVLFIPLFYVLYLNTNFYLDGDYPIYAILIFILSCVLDILDGMFTRRYKLNTLEKVLKPVTNKVFRNAILMAFTIKGVMPLFVVILLGTIDLITLALGTYLLTKKIVFQANTFGKITTIIMNISLFSCFFKIVIYPYNLVLVLISIAMVLTSLIIYIVSFYKLYNLTSINKKI